MSAKNSENKKIGTAMLILKLPQNKPEIPQFNQTYYEVQYPKNAKTNDLINFDEVGFVHVADQTQINVLVGDGKFCEIN